MARRYDQLIDLVREIRPTVIAEVGVHKGLRSVLMCREALKFHQRIAYIGFDVFDTKDAQFHAEALNGKGMPSEQQAAHRLNELGLALEWEFVKGDTCETLHGRTVHADLAFIDGDHRLEVIRGDAHAFAGAKCVVYDDFYSGNLSRVDLKKYGCNRLVNELHDAGRKVQILPARDQTVVGAYAQLAVVYA